MDNRTAGEKIADLIEKFAEQMLDEERAKYAPCKNTYGDDAIKCYCRKCENVNE